MGGLVFGARKLNLVGPMHFVDEENHLFCRIDFASVKLQKGKQYMDSIEGKILRLKKGSLLNKINKIT